MTVRVVDQAHKGPHVRLGAFNGALIADGLACPEPCPERSNSDLPQPPVTRKNHPYLQQMSCKWATLNPKVGGSSPPRPTSSKAPHGGVFSVLGDGGSCRVPTGHGFRVERARGPAWYMKYRLPDGRQVQKKLGPAWTERGRPPAGYFTKRVAEPSAVAAGGKVRIDQVEVIGSSLDLRQLRLVLAWAELHQEELLENWRRRVRVRH